MNGGDGGCLEQVRISSASACLHLATELRSSRHEHTYSWSERARANMRAVVVVAADAVVAQ